MILNYPETSLKNAIGHFITRGDRLFMGDFVVENLGDYFIFQADGTLFTTVFLARPMAQIPRSRGIPSNSLSVLTAFCGCIGLLWLTRNMWNVWRGTKHDHDEQRTNRPYFEKKKKCFEATVVSTTTLKMAQKNNTTILKFQLIKP